MPTSFRGFLDLLARIFFTRCLKFDALLLALPKWCEAQCHYLGFSLLEGEQLGDLDGCYADRFPEVDVSHRLPVCVTAERADGRRLAAEVPLAHDTANLGEDD